MSTKREEKKKLYKDKIIKAADTVFIEKGYNNATIGQISKEAGVGVGTTYLYFKSKSELYRETIKDKLNIVNIEDVFENIDYNEKPSIQVNKVASDLIKLIITLKKDLIKEYIKSFLKGEEDEINLIYTTIVDADNILKVKYNEILEGYNETGLLKDNFNSSICVDIIFDIILESFYKYISTDNIEDNQILKELEEKIKFVIEPYEISFKL